MYCRFCGMEMQGADICEHCKLPQRASTASPQALNVTQQMPPPPSLGQTQAVGLGAGYQDAPSQVRPSYLSADAPSMPAVGGATMRRSLSGDLIADPAPSAPTYGPQHGAMVGMAAPPPPRTGSSLSGLSAAAVSPLMLQQRALMNQTPIGELFEKFLAFALPVMIASVAAVHYNNSLALWVGFADILLLSILMGATRVIPSYDEAFADCALVLLLAFILGPALATIVYLIVCGVRQEMNTAIMNLMAINCVVTVMMIFTITNDFSVLLGVMGLMNGFGFAGLVIAFVGWLISNFFRPLNE